jgi:hypothetical protein
MTASNFVFIECLFQGGHKSLRSVNDSRTWRVLSPAVLQIALAALVQQNNVLKLRDATGKPETGFPLPQLSTRHVRPLFL